MAYYIATNKDFQIFEKSPGFFVEQTGKGQDKFSVTYLHLKNSRDPRNEDCAIEINAGYQAIYIVVEGILAFSFYEESEMKSVMVKQKEYVSITPHTKFDISGNGTILLVCLPAYSENMYSHPLKPKYSPKSSAQET